MLAGIDAIGGFVLGGSAGSLWLDVSQESVFRTAGGTSTQTLATFPVTVTPHGGSGGYTYSWTTSSPDITASTPSAASTAFVATCDPDESFEAGFVCTVHDSSG